MVIPEDWHEERFGDLARLYQDTTVAAHQFVDSGFPVYGANGHIGFYHRFNHESWQTIIACRGSCGDVNRTVDKSWINGNAMVVNVDSNNQVDKEFVYQLLKFHDFSNAVTGSGIPQITRGNLIDIVFCLPKQLREQGAIADALTDADAAIESLESLIAKKRDIKQAMMQKFADPQRIGVAANMVPLGSVVVIEKGEIITSSTSGADTYPVIAGGKEPAYFASKYNRDGLTITVSASGANAGYVALRRGKLWASDCSTISEQDNVNLVYIAAQMQVRQERIYKSQFGGAQPHVRPNDLAALEICLAPLTVQNEMGQLLEDMDDEVVALSKQVAKLRLVKEGMMQDLLTGKVRLV